MQSKCKRTFNATGILYVYPENKAAFRYECVLSTHRYFLRGVVIGTADKSDTGLHNAYTSTPPGTSHNTRKSAFALLFSLCVVIMVLIARHTHLLSADTEPYCVPLFLESKDAIISALGAKEIENTVYASVIAIKGYSTRIMIQEAESFDKSLLSKQRKKANQILNKQLNAH